MSQEVAKVKISLYINIPSDHFITADRNIFRNSVSNIISTKFTERPRTKFINTEELQFADNGIGMSEATLSTLFLQNITE
jgi:signal transduction histidine kinase